MVTVRVGVVEEPLDPRPGTEWRQCSFRDRSATGLEPIHEDRYNYRANGHHGAGPPVTILSGCTRSIAPYPMGRFSFLTIAAG